MPLNASFSNAAARAVGFKSVSRPPLDIEYLVVGGGAGGGQADVGSNLAAGGGGGGGVVVTGMFANAPVGTAFTIGVGRGGGGGFTWGQPYGEDGFISSFYLWDAPGGSGGGGGGSSSRLNGRSGFIGGGGGSRGSIKGTAGVGTIFSGGAPAPTAVQAGGGGGAGGAGGDGAPGVPGAGGAGVISTIGGSSYEYGKGGNAQSSAAQAVGVNGTLYGQGGGGASVNGVSLTRAGGNGFQGVVIIKIPDAYTATFSAGTNTLATSGGFKIYSCTSVGARTVTFS